MRETILQLEKEGRLAEAERQAAAWVAAAPDVPEARHLLALARLRLGRPTEAMRVLEPIMPGAEENPALQVSYGRAALLSGDRMRASLAFEKARRLDPNRVEAYIGLASVALYAGDLEAAESGFRTALRADDEAVEAWLGLGQTLAVKGDMAAATRCFTTALELHPEDLHAQVGMGRSLRVQGYPDFAVQAFENVLNKAPNFAYARLLLAETEMERNRTEAAEKAFSILRDHPEYGVAAQVGLAELALRHGNLSNALPWFEQALVREPAHERALLGLLDCLDRLGQRGRARKILSVWLAQHDGATGARAKLAGWLQEDGQHQAAVTLWREGVEHFPEVGSLHADLTLALERAGALEEADIEAEKAALQGRWIPLTLLRSRAALRAHAFETARDRLHSLKDERLNLRQRRNQQYLLGTAEDGCGHFQQAVEAFLLAHSEGSSRLPVLPEIQPLLATLRGLVQQPPLAQPRTRAPIILVGLPGSAVDRLVSLLALQPGLRVRTDHLAGGADFLSRVDDHTFLRPLSDAELQIQARRYARGNERLGLREQDILIDWLPHLDARVLPLLRRALPGSKLLIAARDPKVCLLDWLMFGYRNEYPLDNPEVAAKWLRGAHGHLQTGFELLPALRVDMEMLLQDPDSQAAVLSEFLGLDTLKVGTDWTAGTKQAGLPTHLQAQRLEDYHETLAAAWSVLAQA